MPRALLPISSSSIDGFFTFEGRAGHTSGWISPIPFIWRSLLGGSYITGQSSGLPIISRLSVGPSAFSLTCLRLKTVKWRPMMSGLMTLDSDMDVDGKDLASVITLFNP